MCGIAGIANLATGEPVDPAQLERMCAVLAHRGPDGSGQIIDGPVGLGHRRLSIVDTSGGGQPLTNEDGSVMLVANGEIYDHLRHRAVLEAAGHRYRTHSDSETLLHLWEEHGIEALQQVRGMFAFALWDRRRSTLLLARDRLGIKPLYWAVRNGSVFFASEIKALLAAGVEAAFDESVLPEFLSFRFVAGERTMFRGIRKLLPGRALVWTTGSLPRVVRWWSPPETQPEDGADLAEEALVVRAGLEEAVASHRMSDVPLGVFLSGGIDSTAIAALAARAMPGLPTFSVGVEGADETFFARLAAKALGTEHHEVRVGPREIFHELPRLTWHEDEPIAFPSSIPLYFVSQLARRYVKVVLTGEGADELFLGYRRYKLAAWNDRLARAFPFAGRSPRRALERLSASLPPGMRRVMERSFLLRSSDPRELVFDSTALFPVSMQRDLFVDPSRPDADDPYATAMSIWRTTRGNVMEKLSRVDLETYLVELLMKQDQMSMAASLESRVPFLDHPLVERALAIRTRHRVGKRVLRRAVADLVPPEILTRPKKGFPVPIGEWLRDGRAGTLCDLLESPRALSRGLFRPQAISRLLAEHRSGSADHGERLWLLAALESWQRVFIDRESVPQEQAPLRTGTA